MNEERKHKTVVLLFGIVFALPLYIISIKAITSLDANAKSISLNEKTVEEKTKKSGMQ